MSQAHHIRRPPGSQPLWIVPLLLLLHTPLSAREPSPESLPPEAVNLSPKVVRRAWPPSEPVQVPCHAKVTTTVLFPFAPEPPDGAGFTQDPGTISGVFRISWKAGDFHLSVAPLANATSRNLNVPCDGRVVVLVFQPVQDPAEACALVEFELKPEVQGLPAQRSAVLRTDRREASPYLPVTPARLIGMMDRLKLLHASGGGERTESLLLAMRGISWSHPVRTTTCGPISVEPVLCLRDERLDLLGFTCVLVNTGSSSVRLEPSSLAARAGAGLHRAATADAPSHLEPGAAAPAFFVVQGTSDGSPGHLAAHNDWLLSIEILGGKSNLP
jgi:hypothetical protein